MFNDIKYLEVGEARYPLAFTINVTQEIQKKYGSTNKILELIKGKNDGEERDIEAVIFFLREAINEGIDIENENKNNAENRLFLTEKQVGRILTKAGLGKAFEAIGQSVKASVPNTSKNAKPMKNRKI